MTRLRVYRGPETSSRFSRIESLPDVLSFTRFVSSRRNEPGATALQRAKALHKNRRCRHCGHGIVDPVTLNDGMRDGSGQYIPGTATLVGFHCVACHAEWPVYEPSVAPVSHSPGGGT